MKANISPMSKPKLHLRTLLFATVAYIIMVNTIKTCHSFIPTSHRLVHHQATTTQRKSNVYPRSLFRELIMDDEEDLRADITVIKKTDGLDNFLKEDDRLCVIKLYAPYCKACRAFRIKFRKLAMEKGDLINTAGKAVRSGDARFGEIDYASNVKVCKNLGVKKFPTVLIFRGGGDNIEKLSEIVCKQTAIEDIVAEIDQLMLLSGR
mmetsp:Transcript_12354/g.19983  ORF Transcript_12354/g.19983 Transcript_12354/m.19983 type:complete len:207 (-) Transcript_12354:517-1137(-)